MSQTYVQRRRAAEPAAPAEKAEAAPRAFPAGPVSPAQPGKPLVLSEAIRAKMENAFGADLSAVRLYENPAVAEAGARAVAQGSRIAFAPGSADFHTRTGQALLGHELSHVLSQARGEVSGRGLLVDRSLEARADREGELAAAGADALFDSAPALAEALLEGDVPRGLFITLEGSDGCGKSTQIAKLKDWLEQRGYEVALTREPGGCPISERVREVILSLDSRGMSPECEALLYAAARVEHVREVIEPALKSGKIVICDRFLDSSIAYQAYGRELGEDFIRQINEPAVRHVFPDLTLMLEVSRSDARRRMAAGAPLDRLEIEKEDFFARVQSGYERLADAEPGRVARVDAGRSIEAVFESVKSAVEKKLTTGRGA